MYLMKSNLNAKKVLKYSKDFVLTLPRREKIDFFCKFIIYSIENKDKDAIAEGLLRLFSMNREFLSHWRSANKSYTDQEREHVNMLFRHAYPRIPKNRK